MIYNMKEEENFQIDQYLKQNGFTLKDKIKINAMMNCNIYKNYYKKCQKINMLNQFLIKDLIKFLEKQKSCVLQESILVTQ